MFFFQELKRDMLIEDSEGKPFPAINVFTEAIRYIKVQASSLKCKLINIRLKHDIAAHIFI
jgi:hypothetical protein